MSHSEMDQARNSYNIQSVNDDDNALQYWIKQ